MQPTFIVVLVIYSGCKRVPSIWNLFDNVGKLIWFLAGIAKRKEIFLQTAVNEDKELLEQSVKACQNFVPPVGVPENQLFANYISVLHALDNVWITSTGDAKTDAGSYMCLLKDSRFILSFIGPVIKSLQAKDCKLALAKECISDVRKRCGIE